LNFLKLKF